MQLKRILPFLGLAAALLLAGCSKNVNNEEAVRQGVISYLAKQSSLDLSAMDISVASVTFKQNEADAVIAFRPKGATSPANAMQMKYVLEKQGSGWVVKSKSGMAGDSHTGAMQQGGEAGGQAMPPGHPAPMGGEAGSSAPSLPPGHPPLGSMGKPPDKSSPVK